MTIKKLVGPEEVYDFLKVIWPAYGCETNLSNISLMINTLSDPDCVRWLSENIEFGSQDGLDLLNVKYDWEVDDELPIWLESVTNRLLLIREIVEGLNL